MKILHISDIHIDITATKLGKLKIINGENETHKNRIKMLEKIIMEYQSDIDVFVFSGDIFNKAKPYPQEYEDLIKILLKTPKTIPTLLIPGNHDEITQRGCALQPLSWIRGNINISLKSEIYSFYDNLVFITAPWGTKIEEIKKLREKIKEKPILVFHCGVWSKDNHWVELDGESGNVSLQQLQELDCEAVMLGHHHNQVELSQNIWYAGSPEVFYFGEENDDKGFLIWNIEKDYTKVTKYSTKELSPPWKTFSPTEFLEYDNDFDGYVRVKGEVDDKERLSIIKKLNNFKCLDYKLDLQSNVKKNRVFQLKGNNDTDILKNYLKSKDIKNTKELLEIDKNLII